MQFDMVSDLHVEMNRAWDEHPAFDGESAIYPWHLERKSDVLVLAGDCANDPYTTLGVVEEAQRYYEHVIFTDGNHEHYTGRKSKRYDNRGDVDTHCNLFRRYMRDNPKVTFLDGTTWFESGRTIFIGANAWYNFMAHSWLSREQQHQYWKQDSNDSRMIEFPPDGYPDRLAQKQAELLRQQVIELQDDKVIDEIVVITHTIPHRVGMLPDNHPWGYLNGAYMNTLMESVWIADVASKIKAWCFGHTHFHCDSVTDGVRFINNARGYYAYRNGGESGYDGLCQVDTQEDLRSAFLTQEPSDDR